MEELEKNIRAANKAIKKIGSLKLDYQKIKFLNITSQLNAMPRSR